MRKHKSNGINVSKIVKRIIIAAVIFIFVINFAKVAINLIFIKDITATVTEKNIKRIDDEDVYLVFTKDSEGEVYVFKVTDSTIPFRKNSSDVYGGIEVGKTYTFTVRGIRFRLTSSYQNIFKYEEITE